MNHSNEIEVARNRASTRQFVEFVIDEKHYAFAIESIQEIVILSDVTPTPQVAACVDGVSNLRGSIIPIINLRVLLGLPRKQADDESRTIVLRVSERTMGCTVDSVTQVLRVADDQIQPAPQTIVRDEGDSIAGFANLDSKLVIILDAERLLDVQRLQGDAPMNLSAIATLSESESSQQ